MDPSDGGELDSLFAGMDFVTPASVQNEDFQPNATTFAGKIGDLVEAASGLSLESASPISLEKSAGDHETASGLPISSLQDSINEMNLLRERGGKDLSVAGDARESVMAACDKVVVKPLIPSSSAALLAPESGISRPNVRRKKRSLKIGYGRGSDGSEEGVQIKALPVGKTVIRSPDFQAAEFDSSSSCTVDSSASDEMLVSLNVVSSLASTGSSNRLAESTEAQHVEIQHVSDTIRKNDDEVENLKDVSEIPFEKEKTPQEVGKHSIQYSEDAQTYRDSGKDSLNEVSSTCANAYPAEVTQDASLTLESRISGNIAGSKREAIVEGESVPQPDDAPQTIPESEIAEEAPANSVVTDTTFNDSEEGVPIENEDEELVLNWNVPLDCKFEERLDFIKLLLASKLERLQQKVANLSLARKVAAQKRRQAAEKVSTTSARFKELEAELQIACEREDFERADSLSESVVVAEQSREAAFQAFRAIETECDGTTSKMQAVLELRAAVEEEGAKLLQQLGQEAADAAEHTEKEAEQRADREMKTLMAEEEAVNSRKSKLSFELKAVEEANSEINKLIDGSIQAETEEKTLLVEKHCKLVKELDDLLELVRVKKEDIAENEKLIKGVEEKIHSIVARFENERLPLKADYEGLSVALQKLENESESLLAKKNEIETYLVHTEEEKGQLESFVKLAKKEAQMLENSMCIRRSVAVVALQSREKRASLAEKEKQDEEQVQALRQQASSIRVSLQELTSEKAGLHLELTTAHQRLSYIEKRVPEIEAEKKLAAVARNFKEAGRLAAEAKVLFLDKEAVISNLNRTMLELQKFEKKMECHMDDLSGLEMHISEREQEAAMARCERLRLLAAATRDERDMAVELEDFDEAECLNTEAEAADIEADQLQRIHGFEGSQFEKISPTSTFMMGQESQSLLT
eukprot:c28678_g1_i1 orf=212-2986(+)